MAHVPDSGSKGGVAYVPEYSDKEGIVSLPSVSVSHNKGGVACDSLSEGGVASAF